MLPVQDVIPTRTTPWGVIALIGVMAAVMAVEAVVPPDTLGRMIDAWGLVPARPAAYALLTSAFLHYGLLHTAADLVAIWILGASVEDRLGHPRLLALALAASAGGNLLEAIGRGSSTMPVLGAAGLVSGLAAAHLVLFPKSRVLVLVPTFSGPDAVEVPTLTIVGFWFLIQALGTVRGVATAFTTAGPAILATLGGAVVGLAAVWLLRRRARETPDWYSPLGRE